MSETQGNVRVLDLDTLLPERKEVTLKGKKFDVTELPLGLAMKMVQLQGTLATAPVESQLDTIVDLITDVLKGTDPEMTREWVMINLGMTQMRALIDFIVEDISVAIEESSEAPQESGEAVGSQQSSS